MGEGKPNHDTNHPATRQQGGVKDTNDLSDIKDIQEQGMKDKGQQVKDLPEKVIGTDTPKYPQGR